MKLQKDFVVRIGGNDYADTPHLLACKGEPLLTVLRDDDSGKLDVRLDIYDEDGRKQATVRRTELTRGSAKRFDVRATENQFKIVDRKRDRVVCNIRRRAHARDMDIDVSLLMHTQEGFLVHANPDQTNLRTRNSEDILRSRDAALSIN